MRRFTATAVVIGLAFGTAPAGAEEHTTAFEMGIGLSTCAEFAQTFQASISIEDSYFKWAQGYMSGFNTAFAVAKAATRDLNGLTLEDEKTHIRDYCSTHPLDQYVTAVADLYFSLPLVHPVASPQKGS
jgi:hypothetical protein